MIRASPVYTNFFFGDNNCFCFLLIDTRPNECCPTKINVLHKLHFVSDAVMMMDGESLIVRYNNIFEIARRGDLKDIKWHLVGLYFYMILGGLDLQYMHIRFLDSNNSVDWRSAKKDLDHLIVIRECIIMIIPKTRISGIQFHLFVLCPHG